MKKITILLISLMLVFALVACGGNSDNTDTDTDTEATDTTDTSTDAGNTDNETDTATNETSDSNDDSSDETDIDTDDVQGSTYDKPTVENILKNELAIFDKADAYGNEGDAYDWGGEPYKVDLKKDASNKRFGIDQSGIYRITGTSNNGGIYINAPEQTVVLVLEGMSLKSNGDYPAIYAEDCKSLTIVLVDGTQNYLYDTANNAGEDAVLRVRSCNLTIMGKGTLNIEANAKYGISNTKELTIESGNINITSPGYAIYGKKGVNIDGGKLSLTSLDKGGIKSGDPDDKDGAVVGYVKINSSSTTITCTTNGINSYGPVEINDGRIAVKSTTGNAIEATEDITINGGTMIFESYKSAITTDTNVSVGGNANLKLVTNGNGISAVDVTISTSGVIYIKTSAVYEAATADTPEDDTRYIYFDGEYVKYDTTIHSLTAKLYIRRDCRGVEADGKLKITNGIIGINSHEDAFNVNEFESSGGKIVISTIGDTIDALTKITISNGTDITVVKAEKGLKACNVLIEGGTLSITAEKDSINAKSTEITGGTLYLFEKIDLGTSGTVSVSGGTVLIVCTNNKAQATDGTAKYISSAITNKDTAIEGAWLQISSGNSDCILVQLPKDYTEKMAVYYSSATIGTEVTVEIGTVLSDGTFAAETTETIK